MIPAPPSLRVAVRKRVHDGLTIDAAFAIGRELAVLFGPSGAGKTTILRLIAGLDAPDAGVIAAADLIFFDRTQQVHRRLRDRRVGYVFQHDNLFPHLDVAGNLRYGLQGQAPAAIKARVGEVADLFGITALLARRVASLSGGERQRVGMARAVAPRPRVLLCDEPVSALDLEGRYRLLDRLKQVQRAESIPVLLVTHAVDEALAFGDRLFLLDGGRIVAQGPPDRMLAELSSRPFAGATPLQNVFAGVVANHEPAQQATLILLADGPALVIPAIAQPVGSRVFVRVAAEEIVLARGMIGTVSARNLLAGTIDQIIVHDSAAEVAVLVGNLIWMVGIIAPTVRSLDLKVGDAVQLIIKARSCRLLTDPRILQI